MVGDLGTIRINCRVNAFRSKPSSWPDSPVAILAQNALHTPRGFGVQLMAHSESVPGCGVFNLLTALVASAFTTGLRAVPRNVAIHPTIKAGTVCLFARATVTLRTITGQVAVHATHVAFFRRLRSRHSIHALRGAHFRQVTFLSALEANASPLDSRGGRATRARACQVARHTAPVEFVNDGVMRGINKCAKRTANNQPEA